MQYVVVMDDKTNTRKHLLGVVQTISKQNEGVVFIDEEDDAVSFDVVAKELKKEAIKRVLKNSKFVKISLLIMIFSVSSIGAQNDTVFLSKDWKKISKDSAKYYSLYSPKNNGYYCKTYSIKNLIQSEGFYSSLNPDVKEGKFLNYSDDGDLIKEANYKEGKLNGELILYNGNKNIWRKENYKDGLLNGELTMYYKTGVIKRKEIYANDKMTYGNCYSLNGSDSTYFFFEEMPAYGGGGEDALMKFIQKNVKYPKEAKKQKIQGKVIVTFVIEKEGDITDVIVIKGVHPLLDEEAIRVIKNMPNWKPGRQDGVPVRVHFNLPINFHL